MKNSEIKQKVDSKIAKAKDKIAKKCDKAAKCLAFLCALTEICAGCSTADAPTAQRAQSITAKDITITFNLGGCTNGVTPNITVEVATAAQANENAGTETMTTTATQTPTNDVKPTTTFTYGLNSAGTSGTEWISQLTAASAKGLAEWLKSGEDGNITVTKTDGTTETVSCKDGVCSPSTCSDSVTCSDCTIK